MNCRDCVGIALASVVIAPIVLASASLVLASTPLLLPVIAVKIYRSTRRFWKLRIGDVIGSGNNTFIVLHPPNRTAEFRCIRIGPHSSYVLNVWEKAEDAHEFFFKVLPTSLNETIFVPMCPKGREPLSKIAEWLAQPPNAVHIHARVGASRCKLIIGNADAAQHLTRISEFELLRPVRLIQRAWRAYSARRRQAAAHIITQAALRFLYRPGGWGYATAESSWCALGCS